MKSLKDEIKKKFITDGPIPPPLKKCNIRDFYPTKLQTIYSTKIKTDKTKEGESPETSFFITEQVQSEEKQSYLSKVVPKKEMDEDREYYDYNDDWFKLDNQLDDDDEKTNDQQLIEGVLNKRSAFTALKFALGNPITSYHYRFSNKFKQVKKQKVYIFNHFINF